MENVTPGRCALRQFDRIIVRRKHWGPFEAVVLILLIVLFALVNLGQVVGLSQGLWLVFLLAFFGELVSYVVVFRWERAI